MLQCGPDTYGVLFDIPVEDDPADYRDSHIFFLAWAWCITALLFLQESKEGRHTLRWIWMGLVMDTSQSLGGLSLLSQGWSLVE